MRDVEYNQLETVYEAARIIFNNKKVAVFKKEVRSRANGSSSLINLPKRFENSLAVVIAFSSVDEFEIDVKNAKARNNDKPTFFERKARDKRIIMEEEQKKTEKETEKETEDKDNELISEDYSTKLSSEKSREDKLKELQDNFILQALLNRENEKIN
jgi:hypothetical protein